MFSVYVIKEGSALNVTVALLNSSSISCLNEDNEKKKNQKRVYHEKVSQYKFVSYQN